MGIFKKIAKALAKLFDRDFAEKLWRGFEAATPYLRTAYRFAQIAAAMTPTRSDDEILALATHLGVPALFDENSDRGEAIARIVFRALKRQYPDATDRVLRRAIEIAYGAIKP